MIIDGIEVKPYADLRGVNLSGVDLYNYDLTGCNLEKCILHETVLDEANLTNTNLVNADLTGAYLYRANLVNTNLSGANLTNTDLERVYVSAVKDLITFDNDFYVSAFGHKSTAYKCNSQVLFQIGEDAYYLEKWLQDDYYKTYFKDNGFGSLSEMYYRFLMEVQIKLT